MAKRKGKPTLQVRFEMTVPTTVVEPGEIWAVTHQAWPGAAADHDYTHLYVAKGSEAEKILLAHCHKDLMFQTQQDDSCGNSVFILEDWHERERVILQLSLWVTPDAQIVEGWNTEDIEAFEALCMEQPNLPEDAQD